MNKNKIFNYKNKIKFLNFIVNCFMLLISITIYSQIPSNFSTKESWEYPSNFHFQLSHSGQLLASNSSNSKWVNLWDVKNGKKINSLALQNESPISAFAFSSDDKLLVTTTALKEDLLHLNNGYQLITIWDVATGDVVKTIYGHKKYIYSVAFIKNNTQIVTIGTYDYQAKVWDVKSGNCVSTFKCGSTFRPDISDDGLMVATSRLEYDDDIVITILDDNIKDLNLIRGNNKYIDNLKFSKDGKWLITSSQGGEHELWNLKTKEKKGSIKLNTKTEVLFLDNDKKAILSEGVNLKIVELPSFKLLKTIDLDDEILGMKLFTPNAPSISQYFEKNIEKYYWKERAKIELYKCKNEKIVTKAKKLLIKGKSRSEIRDKIEYTDIKIEDYFLEKDKCNFGEFNFQIGVHDVKSKEGEFCFIRITEIINPQQKTLNESQNELSIDYKDFLEKEWTKIVKEKTYLAVGLTNGKIVFKNLDENVTKTFKEYGTSDFGVSKIEYEEKGNKAHKREPEFYILKQKIRSSLCFTLKNLIRDIDTSNKVKTLEELKRLSNLLCAKVGISDLDANNNTVKDAINSIIQLNESNFAGKKTQDVIYDVLEIWLKHYSTLCTIHYSNKISIDAYEDKSEEEKQNEARQQELKREQAE
jgi:hypothetical protein